MLTPQQRRKKKLYIRYVILFCGILIPFFAFLQHLLLKGTFSLPISSTILIFTLINLNGLLLLLMLYLILRNLVELIFERSQRILGSKLRTRLVVSFVSLSIVPTAILFIIALSFISTSMDYWFNSNVEESLQSSLKLAQSIFHQAESESENMGKRLARQLENSRNGGPTKAEVGKFFAVVLHDPPPGVPDALTLMNEGADDLVSKRGKRLLSIVLPEIPTEALRLARDNKKLEVITQDSAIGELVRSIIHVNLPGIRGNSHYLVTTLLIPAEQLTRMQTISKGIN
ncbi:MAG: PAS domain-containing sensor histidine kinase, partial [Deltaproteobacteria bacterium]|nr:PAS domain-containing sensor histidine kinase [Deltaproteobacteria bacterium]